MKSVDAACRLRNQFGDLRVPPDMKRVEDNANFIGGVGGGKVASLPNGVEDRTVGGVHGVERLKTNADGPFARIGDEGCDAIGDHLARFFKVDAGASAELI